MGTVSAKEDFLVTFYTDTQAQTRMLSDVIRHSDDDLYKRALGLPEDFVIPFFQTSTDTDEVGFSLVADPSSAYSPFVKEKPVLSKQIENGDCISFGRSSGMSGIRTLFIDNSSLDLGYDRYALNKGQDIFIGRLAGSNQIAFSLTNYISREHHAVIRVDQSGKATVEDLKQSVGIYVNGKRVTSQALSVFDEIDIMGLSIIYLGDYLAVRRLSLECSLRPVKELPAKHGSVAAKQQPVFVRTPRIMRSLHNDSIEIDAPPSAPSMDSTPAILVLGPSVTMAAVMLASVGISIRSALQGGNTPTLISSGIMAIGMLMGALMWPLILRHYQKKMTKKAQEYRKEKYSAYIDEIDRSLEAEAEATVRMLNESFAPSSGVLSTLMDSAEGRLHLWERSYEDSDFLQIRLGQGRRSFNVEVKIPRKGFELYDDELKELPAKVKEKYSDIEGAPITLDLKNNHTIGIIGEDENVRQILNEIIINIISLHSYDEVKLALVLSPDFVEDFKAFRDIPHLWSGDGKVRYFATDPDEAHHLFSSIDEILQGREGQDEKKRKNIPHFIVIVTDPKLIMKESISRYLNDAENNVGLTTIFAYEDITVIPKSCATIIESDQYRTGFYTRGENANRFISLTLDKFEKQQVYRFASELSHIRVMKDQTTMGIVDRISFLQMYKAGNVKDLNIEQHWDNNSSEKSLAAPVGVMAGGEVFSLDIHEAYHGCHGLVAGTTGSGKSEFLQEFILSLAINYSPREVAFVLVDFKGGDMARPFMAKTFSPALPHLAATISNLSGNTLYRALVSLEAEIKYRQRLFNQAASELEVDKLDINSYHKYFKAGRLKTPLPHLVIIIDEFAQLKTQMPEFMTQLINVAQVGRSLGIHLILATQKPSGIVDPQIASNSRFKVCLKVAEKQDSIDMINRPDAAYIKNPGRLYLQVGYDEIYECMQSGYSGADYVPTEKFMPDEKVTVRMTDGTGAEIHSAKLDLASNRTDSTQLEAVVSEIVALGQKKDLKVKPLWLEPLSGEIALSTLRRGNKGLCTATVGVLDLVRRQEQVAYTIDLSETGHIGLYGASGMGKTTFLHTLVYSMVHDYAYTPEELNLYIFDFGGRSFQYMKELPHTKGIAFAEDEDRAEEMVSSLQEIVDERKRLFAAANCGTFMDYRKVGSRPLPAIVVLIDNYMSFRDKYIDIADDLTPVIADGRTAGIYFVITGSTKDSIYYKVTEYISSYITLKMNDKSNYLDILNVHPPIYPDNIPGRAITVIDREVIELQVALASSGENESERLTNMVADYRAIGEAWKKSHPEQSPANSAIETLTDNKTAQPVSDDSDNKLSPIPDNETTLILGKSKSGALDYGLSLDESNTLCVCGSSDLEMAACYQNIIRSILSYEGRELIFIDGERGLYKNVISGHRSCGYYSSADDVERLISELPDELNGRLEDEEKRKDKLFVFISDYNEFFSMITNEQAAFFRKIFKYINSPEYGMYFICGFNVNGDKNNDSLFMSLVVNAQNYLICDGSYEEAAEKIETIPAVPATEKMGSIAIFNGRTAPIRW